MDGHLDGLPTAVDGTLYASSAGLIYALDAWTGTPRWTHPTNHLNGRPVVADERLYFRSGRLLQALNATNGNHLWTHCLPDSISTQPVAADGLVYFGFDGSVYALHAATGSAADENAAQAPTRPGCPPGRAEQSVDLVGSPWAARRACSVSGASDTVRGPPG
ncbi:PQQ-binding-like beta-propeller repeat protein [Streptomyces sp. NPDC051907]|uniref:PQQ-binding-like beta-propeller repeat protein n=1 Tax=Streptomyces sp. NPDC051907 TaxID=3155284 RepID=UPI003424A04F